MIPLIAATLIAFCNVSDAANQIAVQSVGYQPSGAASSGHAPKPITRIVPQTGNRWGRYDVVATVQNDDGALNDVFVLSTVEVLVAPRELPPELRGRDLSTAVGWGVLVTSDYLASQVVRLAPSARQTLRVLVLDIDRILARSFSSPDDALWPYMFRTTVRIVNADGEVLASRAGLVMVDQARGKTVGR
jgi:hypothetical protein